MTRLARRFLFLVARRGGYAADWIANFTWIAGCPPFDTFYMTLTTVTTVGYGGIHLLGQAGRRLQFLPEYLWIRHPRASASSGEFLESTGPRQEVDPLIPEPSSPVRFS